LPRVDLAIVGDPASADAVGQRVTSWFHGSKTHVWTTKLVMLDPAAVLAPASQLGVQAWIVLVDPSVARVFFAVEESAGTTPRFLVTDVALDSGLDELGLERLAQVVFLSAGALWAGNVESSRADVEHELHAKPGDALTAPPPLFLQPPPPEPKPPLRAELGAEYAAMIAGDAGTGQAVRATIRISRGGGFAATVRGGIIVPHEAQNAGVGVELSALTARAGAGVQRALGASTTIEGELGAGIDVVMYRVAMLDDPNLRALPEAYDTQPLAYARTGMRFRLGERTLLLVEAVLDVELRRTHYDIVQNGNELAVVTPWLVQPGVSAGLAW
jgi:hypothetical protein